MRLWKVMFLMANKKTKELRGNRSDFARLVNLIGLEKREAIVASKVESCVKRAISLVLKPGQTPSEWIRETILIRLRKEAT